MALSSAEFETLALQQMDTLYRVACRLVRDRAEAEDLVQETYLRALRGREGFKLDESYGIRPWLLRIMRNLHISRLQKQGRQPQVLADEELQMADPASAEADLPPIDLNSADGMDQRLVRALESLAPEYQAALLMWAVEGLAYKEIAHVMDIPMGTVMSRLYRARQKLMEQLRELALETRIIRE